MFSKAHDCHCKAGDKRLSRTGVLFWILVAVGNILISAVTTSILLRHPTLTRPFTTAEATHLNSESSMKHSLFGDALQFPTVQFDVDAWLFSNYTGPPSHASDKAWASLQEVRGIQISPSQASLLNHAEEGLFARNGTLATILGVQHNLHCIRILRQTLYPTYYYPDHNTDADQGARAHHAGHCLEAIRQSVMCTPDLIPRAVRWADNERLDVAVIPSVTMQCLSWDSLRQRMRGMTYDLKDLWDANPSE